MIAAAALLVALVGVTGLAIGSFLNVVVYRVPAGMSVVHPRSACPNCGHEITARENIPLLSWLVLQWIAAAEFIPHAEFHLNYRIFLYAIAVTVFFGVFSGVYPAWRMSRLHPISALKGGIRT